MKCMRGFAFAALLAFLETAWAGPPQAGLKVEVSVIDQDKLAVPAVRLQLRAGDAVLVLDTDERGRAIFADLRPARYHLSLASRGFTPIERDLDLSTGASQTLELTLIPALERTEVEVKGVGNAVEQGSSPATAVSGQLAKEMPSRPATVADALPLVPGVVREPGGALRISDSPENRSALIVNSADVTDPATGQFGLTVPDRQRADGECLPDGLSGRVRTLYRRTGVGGNQARRRQMEVGIERPVAGVPHSQLAPARAEDGHAAAEFRRPAHARQALYLRRLRIRSPQDGRLHAAVSAQPEAAEGHQFVHATGLGRHRQATC